jgi:hypothetical protein
MKIKTADLTALQLDYLITSIEVPKGIEYGVKDWREQRNYTIKHGEYVYRWSTSWNQGGLIVDRERIDIEHDLCSTEVVARKYLRDEYAEQWGPTALIAAMRCFVASKLGDEVDIPEEPA